MCMDFKDVFIAVAIVLGLVAVVFIMAECHSHDVQTKQETYRQCIKTQKPIECRIMIRGNI